ncbi:MAG TPA: adenosylcobinamide-GDP ribazoletransferase [Nitrospirota bacterium]
MIRNFITALQFLTVIPVSREHRFEEGDLAKSMVYFPVVGFLIGLLLVYVDKIFALVVLPQSIANLLLVALSVLITRAIHIDGLADTLDGIMGGSSADSRLAIMKDSRLGTAGALGIFFVLLIKYLCLNNLFNGEKAAVLLTAPTLARWSQTLMVFKANYGRENGMGKAFVGHLRTSGFTATTFVAVGLAAFVILQEEARTQILVMSTLVGVALLTLLGRKYLVHKLGGVTGDAIGAISELNEMLVFLLFVTFAD